MEEKTARQLVKDVGAISDFLQGNPAFKEKGFIDRFGDLEAKVDKIAVKVDMLEQRGIKVKWFWAGWGTAAGAGAYATVKSSWFAKAVAWATGAGAAEKMIK